MKTSDKIKKGIEGCLCDLSDRRCEECPYADGGCESITCEKELGDNTLALIQQLDAQVPKWISVEERLPEDDVAVLVYAIGNNENSCVAMTSYTHHMYGYNIEGWRSPWQYFFYERKITHWMPLPSSEGLHDD